MTNPEFELAMIADLKERLQLSHNTVDQLAPLRLTGSVAIVPDRVNKSYTLNMDDWKRVETNKHKGTAGFFSYLATVLDTVQLSYVAFARFVKVDNAFFRNQALLDNIREEYHNSLSDVDSTDPIWKRKGSKILPIDNNEDQEAIFFLTRLRLTLLEYYRTVVTQSTMDHQWNYCRVREIDGADMHLVFHYAAYTLKPKLGWTDENLDHRFDQIIADLPRTLMSRDKESARDSQQLSTQYRNKLADVRRECPDMPSTAARRVQEKLQAASRVATEAQSVRKTSDPSYEPQAKLYLPKSEEEGQNWKSLMKDFPPFKPIGTGMVRVRN